MIGSMYASMWLFILLVVIVVLSCLVFNVPDTRWASKIIPTWLATCIIIINSLCWIAGIPYIRARIDGRYKTPLISIGMLTVFMITAIFIKPSWQLSPLYSKIILRISVCSYILTHIIQWLLNKLGSERRNDVEEE